MLEEVRAPLHLHMAATVGRWLTDAGVPLFPLEPALLLRQAQRRAGRTDFEADDLFHDALERLCQSALEDANLHNIGRFGVHDTITTALTNRLLWVDARRREPQRFTTPLQSPLLVVGFPRSGTTLLHRLLALADDARSLKTWEVQLPLPPIKGRDKRHETITAQLRRLHHLAPSLALKHPIAVDDAEEDFWLLNPSLLSPTFYVFAPLDGYGDWHRQQAVEPAYALWASLLAWFQSHSPTQRLTLKAPAHTGYLREAINAVPNLAVVQIHRDPVDILGSLNSLLHTLQALVSSRRDPVALGTQNLSLVQWHATRNLEARNHISDHIMDVSYTALMEDPAGLIERIHQHFDLPFRDAHRNRIQDYVAHRPQHQHGRHLYTLEECGLTDTQVRDTLAFFTQHFSLYAAGNS